MPEYIALLRGVNVGGHTVRMDRLRSLFEQMGCTGVSTVIQSGNVLFDGTCEPAEALRMKLESGLKAGLGFDVPVVLLTPAELGGILSANPYAGRQPAEGERVYVTVLAETPSFQAAASLMRDPRSADEFRLIGRAAYVLCRNGYNDTAYSNAFFEKKLKAKATTRNLETMTKLAELASLDLRKMVGV